MQATQPQTLRTLTALHLLHQNWGGRLIVSTHLNPAGASLAIAATIAGACCLSIDPDHETLKTAMREGTCDFVVTTLDEALRTLKNEVRKKQPLSVGLLASPEILLAELADRGVLPDLLNAPSAALQAQGAIITNFTEDPQSLSAADRYAEANNWRLTTHQAKDNRELANFDAALLAALPPEDTLNRQWLRSAPRFFRRELPLTRTYWATQ